MKRAALIPAALIGAVVLLFLPGSQEKLPAKVAHSVGAYASKGLRTSFHDDKGLRLRISAESLRFVQPRAFGPFRIGFLKSLEAAGVAVETFARGESSDSNELSASDAAGAISSLLRETDIAKRGTRGTVGVDLLNVRIVRQEHGEPRVLLEAARCRTSLTADQILCEKGALGAGERRRVFLKAQYDGHDWKLTEGQSDG